jgi:hypothetical protein
MTSASTTAADEIVALVSGLAEQVFDALKPVQAATEALLAEPGGARAADLARLRPAIAELLTGLVIGAGFVAAPRALADQHLGFEWWGLGEGDAPEQLTISLDPDSDQFLDYTRQSWFTVPRDTGRRHINGPYVDYLCTDEYTLTFTVPVHGPAAPGFLGVVGADVYVREFERRVLPRLRALPGRAALVNAQGRVIASTSARQATGSLVREPSVPAWWTSGTESRRDDGVLLRRCGDTPIALLAGPG